LIVLRQILALLQNVFEKNLESHVLSDKNLQLLHRTVELQLGVKAQGLGFRDFPQVT
jgi:hypothetical protein